MVISTPNEAVAYLLVVWTVAYVGAIPSSVAGLEAFETLIGFWEEVGVRRFSHEIYTVIVFIL